MALAPKPVSLTAGTLPTGAYSPEPLLLVGGLPAGAGPAGTNIAASGRVTLVAGTATVNTAKALTASNILLTVQSLGTVTAATPVAVTARVNGTSFTITSSSNTDTSVIGWAILS